MTLIHVQRTDEQLLIEIAPVGLRNVGSWIFASFTVACIVLSFMIYQYTYSLIKDKIQGIIILFVLLLSAVSESSITDPLMLLFLMLLLVIIILIFLCLSKLCLDFNLLKSLILGTGFGINIEFDSSRFWLRDWLCSPRLGRTIPIQGQTQSIEEVAIVSAVFPWQNLLTTCRLRWKDQSGINRTFDFGLLLSSREKERIISEIIAVVEQQQTRG